MRARLTGLLLAICLAMGMLPSAADAAASASAVYVNGKKVVYKQAPESRNGTVLVSAKETIEAMGLQFSWDAGNRRVLAASGDVALSLIVGEPVGFVNGVSVFLGAPAEQVNGRVMVPLRFLTEGLGAAMEFRNGTYLIKTAAKSKSGYYSGLPLQITDTSVKNIGYTALNVTYVEFFVKDGEVYTLDGSLPLVAGQKGAFGHAGARLLDSVEIDGAEYAYIGRAVKEAASSEEKLPSSGYAAAENLYHSDSYYDKLVDYVDQLRKQFRQDLKKALAANKNVPLRVDAFNVTYGDFGYPEANVELTNLTEKRIVAFELSFSCYDAYNDPVETYYGSGNRFRGQSGATSIESGNTHTLTWDLFPDSSTAKIVNVTIDRVAFSDGSVWKRK